MVGYLAIDTACGRPSSRLYGHDMHAMLDQSALVRLEIVHTPRAPRIAWPMYAQLSPTDSYNPKQER